MKVDVKDKKLLYYLSKDSRTSHTQLAKKVYLSKNAVKYRIQRLKQLGIIKHFASTVNIGAIQLETFTVLLKFNDDIYENKEYVDYFTKHKFSDWVVTLSGNWDFLVEFICREFEHLYEIVDEIIKKFGKILNTYQIFFSFDTMKVNHLIPDFYKDLNVEEIPKKNRTTEKITLDETDKKILHALSQDSSFPYLSIANKLNITLDIVRYRIKQLLQKGVIIEFFPEVSLKKLGYNEYICIVKLKNLSNEKKEMIRKEIIEDKNISYAFFDIVSFNLLIVCAFRSTEGIDHFSRKFRKSYSDIIEKQEYIILKDHLKFNLFPDGLLNI